MAAAHAFHHRSCRLPAIDRISSPHGRNPCLPPRTGRVGCSRPPPAASGPVTAPGAGQAFSLDGYLASTASYRSDRDRVIPSRRCGVREWPEGAGVDVRRASAVIGSQVCGVKSDGPKPPTVRALLGSVLGLRVRVGLRPSSCLCRQLRTYETGSKQIGFGMETLFDFSKLTSRCNLRVASVYCNFQQTALDSSLAA